MSRCLRRVLSLAALLALFLPLASCGGGGGGGGGGTPNNWDEMKWDDGVWQ